MDKRLENAIFALASLVIAGMLTWTASTVAEHEKVIAKLVTQVDILSAEVKRLRFPGRER